MSMQIRHSDLIPDIYLKCKERFGVSWDSGIAIAYGDTIYSKNPIPDDLHAHEEVHLRRQAEVGIEEWWNRYLEDPKFRLKEEVMAYAAQIAHAEAHSRRKYVRDLKRRIIRDMATLYGGMCTEGEAVKLLGL